MTDLAVADLSHIPVSQGLSATLARASEGARASGAAEVSLEHVLAALCDDEDAIDVLAACNINAGQLKGDAIGYLVQQQGPTGPHNGQVNVSAALMRILEAAAAAARGGRRRDINGAIVLAAIVGDGRSVAAQILQNYGLTFEGAIRALQQAMSQPRVPEMAPAEDVLARARERVQSRAAPSLREIMQDKPNLLPKPAPQSEYHDFVPAPAPASGPSWEPAYPNPAPSPAVAAAPASPALAPPPAAEPAASSPPELQPAEEQPVALQPAPSSIVQPPPNEGMAAELSVQPEPAPVAGSIGMPPLAPPGPIAQPQATAAPQWQPPDFRPPEPLPEPTTVAPIPAQPPYAPAPPPVYPADAAAAPTGGPGAANFPGTYPPPQADFRPDFRGHAPASPPNALQPTGPHQAAPQSLGFERARSGPQPPPIPPPIPRQAAVAPPPGPPQGYGAPASVRAPQGPLPQGGGVAPARAPAPPPKRGAKAEAELGQMSENIPRAMRAGVTERVEVRIARAHVQNVTQGMDGAGAAWRHDVTVTNAMSVRIRAPGGGFFIETASPETQWIDNQFAGAGEDFASWRFQITPQRRGWSELQIIVSARSVGADGLAAETAFPDQVVDVKVRTNYGRALLKVLGWIAAGLAGGVLAKFGEGAFAAGSGLLGRLLG